MDYICPAEDRPYYCNKLTSKLQSWQCSCHNIIMLSPPGGKKHALTHSVTSKLFPPSITFTRAPAAQVMLGTSLDALSPQAHNSDELLTEARRAASGVTDQVRYQVKLLENFTEVRGGTPKEEIRSSSTLHLWESDISSFLLLSAFWQLHYLPTRQQHTVSRYKTQTHSHTTCRRHFARLNLWCSSPSHQLETVCTLVAFVSLQVVSTTHRRTHLNRSYTRKEKMKTRRIKPWLHCEQGQQWCSWWSEATLLITQTCSIFHLILILPLNMNCGLPFFIISWSFLLWFGHKWNHPHTKVLPTSPQRLLRVPKSQSLHWKPELFSFCRVTSWHLAGFNIYTCTELRVQAAPPGRGSPGAPDLPVQKNDRMNLTRMERKWSELISYNGKKKEMDCGRGIMVGCMCVQWHGRTKKATPLPLPTGTW